MTLTEKEVTFSAEYFIHGIVLHLSTNSEEVLEAIDQLMFPFHDAVGEGTSSAHLSFHLTSLDRWEDIPKLVPSHAKVLYRSSADDTFDLREIYGLTLVCRFDGEVIYWDFGERGLVTCDSGGGQAQGFLVGADKVPKSLISHTIFLASLNELLRARGVFPIHAASVSLDGMGVVMSGLSGSGKTTCCISLVLGGFDFLSDDRSLLRQNEGDLEMLSFPEGVDVTENTVAIFPELEASLGHQEKRGARKRSFLMEAVRPGSLVDRCVPRLLLFPTVGPDGKSELQRVSKSWALQQLLPQSLLVFDPRSAARQFDALSSLVEGTESYSLRCGEDIRHLPEIVRRLLKG
jgi:hypothetical protein